MTGRRGTVQIRVRYPEVDRMGVAHHASHFVWFEIGRTELMRSLGMTYARMEEDGIFLPVIEAACSYRAPARYDDLIRVTTEVVRATAVRVDFAYRIERESGDVPLASGTSSHAAVGADGRPRRLPASLLELLA